VGSSGKLTPLSGVLVTEDRMPPALSGISRLAGSSLLRLQTDARLLALTRDGHEAAFAAIVDRYRPELCRYARRLVGDDRAEDAVQQALVNAHAAMLSTDTPLQLRAWLHRITHNAAISTLRRDRHPEVPFDDQVEAGGADDAADDAIGRERLRAALTAVAALPEPQRDALLLQAVDGRSHAEIAAALDVTPGAARQHLHRARASVRAAVTAVTPYGILVKLATLGSAAGFGGAELAGVGVGGAGIGATALVTKVGVGVLAAGAIAGGTATTVHHHGRSHHAPARSVEARTTPRVVRAAAPAAAIAVADADGSGRRGRGRGGDDGGSDGGGGKGSSHGGSDDSGGKGSGHGGSDDSGGKGPSRSGSDNDGGGKGSSHSGSDDSSGSSSGHGGSDD